MKLALQVVLAVLGLLPLAFGTLGLWAGVALYMPADAATPQLDSQFRFMSALDIGLAAIAWWFAAHIERHAGVFRLVCLAVFVGGVGRVAAWLATGSPGPAFAAVTVIELLVPALIPWQAHVQRHSPKQGHRRDS